jgi:hypothetical protein
MIDATRVVVVFGLLASSASAQSAPGQRWNTQTSAHFEIYYQRQTQAQVDAIARETERVYARLSAALQHEFADKMPVIVVERDRDLPRNELESRALVIASQAPPRDHLLLSVEGFEKRATTLLPHELTHQFLFELLPNANRDAPWVSEGLADHHGGSWEQADVRKIRDALATGSVPSVESLTVSDRHWGHAVFDYVAARYGPEGIRRYLIALQSASRDAAIRSAFGVSMAEFNGAFRQYVTQQFVAR